MTDTGLLRRFADTFGLPCTEQAQTLPLLDDSRHQYLGTLAGFYRHIRSPHSESAGYWLETQTLFLQWLPYRRLPEIRSDWAFGWSNQARAYLPVEGWQESWTVFAILSDDSILFADTAGPVYWLSCGYGSTANRRPVAPSLSAFMQTMLAIHRFERQWQAAGKPFQDADYARPEALMQALRGLLTAHLPPDCAAGFEQAFWG